jgi:hypothetical protein
MAVKLLRGILTLLMVTAYVGATMLQFAPSYASNADRNHPALGGMLQDQDDPGDPGDRTPCKGMLPGCVTDLGCIFLLSLPPPELTPVTTTAWSPVSYDNAFQGTRGRTIKPTLGPPILLA